MDRMIYTAASGAARVLEQQAVISNNLANIGTTGFREQMSIYRSVPLLSEAGMPTRVSTVASTPGSDMGQGVMVETGKALDAAISGQGWFSVWTPQGEAYTRAGDFGVNEQGQLVTRQGLPVLSEDGVPMEIPERGAVTFSGDGRVTVLGAGDRPNDLQVIGRLKLVNPTEDELVRGDDGLFRMRTPQPVQADPQVRIIPGFIEKSNVNAAEAMVGMIANARKFEMQMKVIQDAGTNAERANSILSAG
ncbi:flagellar basal-body rod protein FlgF [Allopusillimonas soli]|uniref:Flagellar basal-body rod protein FlgF n=1 Tax=Allopusillimonas soli TaxID=659016 RepID=A0A853F4T6_9BURK|nr:flagellar basal-body rod protein FlgF [Allopusillimonas soli]NYT35524.1 flagellar basal-body rod protein FlgF [Allopusillimonas soli]TEA75930.1 flagellar basal-body rod protein FlgF [Allopusillimonas soli]